MNIHGYNIYRNDRDRNGGGVAIYVKKSLPEPMVKITCDKLELIELEFNRIHANSFLIISCYHPPTTRAGGVSFQYLRDLLKEADKDEKEIFLIGDTNCDLNHPQNSNTKKLKMIYFEHQLEQLINKYTRIAVTTI